jgi:large subunit ribosomal protein L25
MKEINVAGKKRNDLGKKASKLLRKEGMIPCNLYGEKRGEDGLPVAFAFTAPMSELRKLVYTPHIYVVNLEIDGEKHGAIMKELQFDPVTDSLLHVDFYEVNEDKPIVMEVPVKLEGTAPGVLAGGRMNLTVRKLAVKASFQIIPEHLVVNVSKLKIGKSIKVGQLNYEGLELVTSKDVVVCSIKSTRQSTASADDTNEDETSAEEA